MSAAEPEPIALRGPSIRTFTRRFFYPSTPRPEEIHIVDVAHHLSTINRFGGTLRRRYTVAPHCVCAALLVRPTKLRGATLMHEVAEALSGFGDMVGQVKRIPEIAAVIKPRERLINDAASVRFGLPVGFAEDPDVKAADALAYACENRDLRDMPEDPAIVGLPRIVQRSDIACEWSFLCVFAELFPDDPELPDVARRLREIFDHEATDEDIYWFERDNTWRGIR